jgi:hypothetical protein
MKIAILTRPCGKNYGGIFQCLALQNILAGYDHDVKVIKFESKIKNGILRKILIFFSVCSNAKDLYNFFHDTIRAFFYHRTKPLSLEMMRKRLDFVNSHINFTEKVDEFSIGKLAQEFDAIIVGSDIVWTGLGRRFLSYLFDWNPEFEGMRISYAACSPTNSVPFFNRKKIKKLFSQFNALSVRDTTTYELVYNISGLKPSIVVDPTFLYNYECFIGPAIHLEPYIFAYVLGDRIKGKGGQQTVISQIKKKYGDMKIIAVVIADVSLDAENFADEVVYNASPEEWLNLLYHAAFVYTDSFHGCIFSLKYQKPFLGYYSSARRSSRLKDMAKRYHIDKYIVSSIRDMETKKSLEDKIDFDSINPIINNNNKESIAYIFNSLHVEGGIFETKTL